MADPRLADEGQDVEFDSEFLKKLELLHILAKRLMRERNRGDRRFTTKGTSVEFKDYRNYVLGDDTRYIDWNIFQRLGRLLLKLYEEEVEHHVYLLIDASASMGFGSRTKLTQAKLIAAALAYIALANHDRVSIGVFRNGLEEQLPPVQGKARIWSIFRFLERIRPSDGTGVAETCRVFAHRNRRRGIAVLLSDFLDPDGVDEGIRQLVYRKYEMYLVHTLAPEDERPELRGELTLVDSESGEELRVTVDESTLALYRRTFADWLGEIEEACRKRRVVYLRAPTDAPFDDVVLRMFRDGRLLG